MKEIRRNRRANKLCVDCEDPTETYRCKPCADINADHLKSAKASLREKKLCVDCKISSETYRCRSCTDIKNELARIFRAAKSTILK